ncbi:MAG: hypothetical protein H0V01_04770 [Bacteroidetes bacterium]|nr:hypothetical protein [Bacteroidota bacterium]HET6245951.1 hypothetical protein [Bacteroidia bacterium]
MTLKKQLSTYEIKGEKYGTGGRVLGKERTYTNHSIPIKPGTSIYLFKDGFADQFGGVRGKKFMKKKLKEVLFKISHLEMEEQQLVLSCYLDEWKGKLDQVDDILVIGVRF